MYGLSPPLKLKQSLPEAAGMLPEASHRQFEAREESEQPPLIVGLSDVATVKARASGRDRD